MKNILEEMMTLFPDKFFHLGVDEVTTSTLCSIQNTKSLEQELMKFLVQKGKIPYAWQEALISTSAAIKGTVLQAWKGSVVKTLIDGGFQVINSLSSNFYLSSLVDFSALWTNITAGLNPDEMTLALGGEMAMWTDAWWTFGPESDSQFT